MIFYGLNRIYFKIKFNVPHKYKFPDLVGPNLARIFGRGGFQT